MRLKQVFKKHVKDNRLKYLIVLTVLLLGVIVGSYKSAGLEGGVRGYLLELIDNYLDYSSHIKEPELFFRVFLKQVEIASLVWFLGLTVIGFPLILAAVFWRGFALGFTTSFLIREKAGTGVVIALLSVLPQNLVYMPVFILWAVIALNFSFYILAGNKRNSLPLFKGLIIYTLMFLGILLFIALGAFIEAYFVPWLINIVF
ncbi:stage II sporulation protein M [Thermosyntropha lipolytica DSM 11003]|uniref:Stage II sporulation protein M n=1 Tax=Thermosyntropha lipolytica DSM 11003 TaxID=1123382 RepID=A0A1M5RX93_9FIRM|nr:stage II sporulation protein M [Thermosyntropha lipolytica]SHH30972.1 stage II sporulation protein M [Thermosyntropha lipolytica DSM 11003]